MRDCPQCGQKLPADRVQDDAWTVRNARKFAHNLEVVGVPDSAEVSVWVDGRMRKVYGSVAQHPATGRPAIIVADDDGR